MSELSEKGRVRLSKMTGDFIAVGDVVPMPEVFGPGITPEMPSPTGEPVDLPLAFYETLRSPSGVSIIGWRLTAEGRAARDQVQGAA
ncbi:hypothetical protein [Croceicoccus sp. YJ47]|uniref:hypothetical protein n=1 Tax=Croceicoccus sp. YJ47 TaxID=2798724 RepID=UPI001921DD0E|nr:hypothetical protein [Croceicoccus sp. YJ47]QQN75045.1 hypothetical protein JD971_04935 [Croceicoccus sp. YJ47]